MSDEDIIRMARDAGISIRAHYDETGSTPQELECFFQAAYAAGAAAEREACAVIAETPISGEQDDITMEAKDRVAAAIRARGDK